MCYNNTRGVNQDVCRKFSEQTQKGKKRHRIYTNRNRKGIKYTEEHFTNWEIGRTQPDIESLGILADFYGVSVDWLIGTKGDQ